MIEETLALERNTIDVRVADKARLQAKKLLDASQEWINVQQERQRLRDTQIRKFKEFLIGVPENALG